MRIRIRSDPVIFGPPDPVIFSTDPDPDPTCNNGFIKLFLSWKKYKSESTNSSIKWWVIISNFIPTYLKYKYIFFFISISSRIRSRIRIRNFFSAEPDPDPDPWKKISDPHPWSQETFSSVNLKWRFVKKNLKTSFPFVQFKMSSMDSMFLLFVFFLGWISVFCVFAPLWTVSPCSHTERS